MHIAFVAPECAPWVKTGGLGEVMAALPAALARSGHRVTMFVPFYRAVREFLQTAPDAAEPPVILRSVTVPAAESNLFVRVLDGGNAAGVQTYWVDCPELFDRDGVYGPPGKNYPDNAVRYGSFCRAVIESTKLLGVPDVFHTHDWPTSFLNVLLATTYAHDPMLRDAGSVFTIHNGGYQGTFAPEVLRDLLLPQALFTDGAMATERNANAFRGAVLLSDAVTTVSPTYAEELKTPEFGEGLEALYRERGDSFFGILNGIDTEVWNPASDPNLAAHFSAADLSGKRECRRDLLHAFAAERTPDSTAVFGIVSRMAVQKGFSLIAEAMPRLAEMDLLILVLGSGEEDLIETFQQLQKHYPNRLRVKSEFTETLGHKVQAGSDMALMPSRYEPSGLTQMYSLRYGSVPVVRDTGGLRDTVHEGEEGNGFVFEPFEADAMLAAVRRAVAAFADKPAWQGRMQRGMREQLSWAEPAAAYVRVYERAVERRRSGQARPRRESK